LSLQISVCVNITQIAPCIADGVQFMECQPHAEEPSRSSSYSPSPPIRTSNGACMRKSRRARAGSWTLSA